MADNVPESEGTPPPHALPTAPPLKPVGGGNKVVVALSSVAKAPPTRTQNVPPLAPDASVPKVAPLRPSNQVVAPPPIPNKQTLPDVKLVRPGANAEVKMPPKITTSQGPVGANPEAREQEKPLPAIVSPDLVRVRSNAPPMMRSGSKKTTARLLIPKIKLNQPVPEPVVEVEEPRESIILGPGDTIQERPERPKIVEKPVLVPQPLIAEQPVVEETTPVVEAKAPVEEISPTVEAKPPIEEIPPAAEVKPPIEIIPPAAEVKPLVEEIPVVVEAAKPLVEEISPVIEAKPPVAEIPPVVEAKLPVEVIPPMAEIKPPVTEIPTVSEAKAPVEEKPPVILPAQSMVILPPVGPVAEIADKLQPPVVLSKPVVIEAKVSSRPPPLPMPKNLDKPASPGLQVVPKMIGSDPVVHAEKLPPPQLHPEAPKTADAVVPVPASTTETKAILKAPAFVPIEAKPGGTAPPALPSTTAAKSAAPKISPESKSKISGPIILRDAISTAPVVETKVVPPPLVVGQSTVKSEEGKPALRPATLPNKALKASEAAAATVPPLETKEKATTLPPSPTPLEQVSAGVPYERYQAPEAGKLHAPVELPAKTADKPSVLPAKEKILPPTRAERAKKRRVWEMVVFYIIMLGVGAGLYFGTLRLSKETRVEGQVVPPPGMPLADEVWIVSNDGGQLNTSVAGIAEDLAAERTPQLQEMQEQQNHVQRVQADIAMREERIRLLQAQIQGAKDEEANIVKDARDAAQKLWDGPGAELDNDYNSRKNSLQNAIANRAKSLNLKYAPDPTYNAPEVWANAYRLALYEVPTGVDSAKEYTWLNDQMKQWRDFVKGQDDQRQQLRDQAAQIKMGPASKLADLNSKIDDLQHRIDNTQNEEVPLKPELQQAQADLAETQTTETGLDAKYYKQLSTLPGSSVTKRLPMEPNGRFAWPNLENDSPFAEGENEHHYWIFARATRKDGREYWALGRFSVTKDHTACLLILPDSFVSTKAMLRPDLSPDDQDQ